MKIAVVNFTKVSEGSIIASSKIARFMSEHYGAKLIDCAEACTTEHYDVIFIVNGVYLFCNFREQLEALLAFNEKFIWIGNDYNPSMWVPSKLKFMTKRDFTLASAYSNFKKIKKYNYVNFNALTYEKPIHKTETFEPGLFYYGAFRKDRLNYFFKYFHGKLPYDLYISPSSKKSYPEWNSLSPKANLVEASHPISETIKKYQSSLYIEDNTSHKIYCSPANRFYEILSSDSLILFDSSCENTFTRYGVDIKDFTVSNKEEVKERLAEKNLLQKQRKLFHKDYRKELTDGLLEIKF